MDDITCKFSYVISMKMSSLIIRPLTFSLVVRGKLGQLVEFISKCIDWKIQKWLCVHVVNLR